MWYSDESGFQVSGIPMVNVVEFLLPNLMDTSNKYYNGNPKTRCQSRYSPTLKLLSECYNFQMKNYARKEINYI